MPARCWPRSCAPSPRAPRATSFKAWRYLPPWVRESRSIPAKPARWRRPDKEIARENMNKQQKGSEVEELSQKFGRAGMALVSEYKGMTAAQATELRKRLRAVRGELRVAKNTLVRR